MKWLGFRLTVNRTTISVEFRLGWPCFRWRWSSSLMAPQRIGVGFWLTKDWA
jgi:hypothetical protein